MIDEKEEIVQRALGTLDKFQVTVTRKISVMEEANVFVTAADGESAERRAKELVKEGSKDDTNSKISWAAIDAEGKVSNVKSKSTRQLEPDDYMIHRFSPDYVEEEKEQVSVDDVVAASKGSSQ